MLNATALEVAPHLTFIVQAYYSHINLSTVPANLLPAPVEQLAFPYPREFTSLETGQACIFTYAARVTDLTFVATTVEGRTVFVKYARR